MHLFEVIGELKSNSGSIAKREILTNLDSSLESQFKTFSDLVYNPYRNYYIKKVPNPTSVGSNTILSESSINTLNRISSREVTGNAAISEISSLINSLTEYDQKLLELILKRTLDCGVSVTTVNKIWPKLIPTFNVMLCTPLNEKSIKKINWPAYVQVKYDAARVAIIVKEGNITYFTRNGKVYNIENPQLDADILSIADGKDVHIDGELYQESGDRVSSNAVTTKFVRNTATAEDNLKVRIVLWDLVDLTGFNEGKDKTPYSIRLHKLTEKVLTVNSDYVTIATTKELVTIEQAKEWSNELIREGEEGVIIKNKDAVWEGKRSAHCIKIKEELESDLKIVSLEYGQGKFTNACGAIQCESSDGKVKVSVGSGLNDELRLGEFHPDNNDTLKGRIITVRYNGIIQDSFGNYSLYLPRFIELREDKDIADDLQKIKDEGK